MTIALSKVATALFFSSLASFSSCRQNHLHLPNHAGNQHVKSGSSLAYKVQEKAIPDETPLRQTAVIKKENKPNKSKKKPLRRSSTSSIKRKPRKRSIFNNSLRKAFSFDF